METGEETPCQSSVFISVQQNSSKDEQDGGRSRRRAHFTTPSRVKVIEAGAAAEEGAEVVVAAAATAGGVGGHKASGHKENGHTENGRKAEDRRSAIVGTAMFQTLKKKLGKRDPLHNLHHFRTQHHMQVSSLNFVSVNVMIALVIMLSIQLMAVVIWPACEPGVPCKDRKSQREMFTDIIDARVPPLKRHAKDVDFSPLGSEAGIAQESARDCVAPWMDTLRMHVENTSNPALVREVMHYLRLTNVTSAREALGSLWSEPVNFDLTLDEVATCTRQNTPLHAALCLLLDKPEYVPQLVMPEKV